MNNTQQESQQRIAAEQEADYTNPLPSGGHHKKTDFGSVPSPIRYFGYFFFTSATVMLVIGVVIQWFK
ncbi:hypothetical protein N0M98_32275 [Paenibacillus doosanensis]|uniref:hypothetical protein n=1 Tax=Paenibacillus doosanensis TaxID=1229154 RepID=UPI0021803463|nr:hypothetical protein [Paenibacillus doosanensis]MCS7464764.1 hypothetical protein [Paenibacillus doosanensis]